MTNKAISELTEATSVNEQDLFVLEQSGLAKKMTAETFITAQNLVSALATALAGHGGISSVTLSSVSGRIRTYLITFTDTTTTTFQVYDGTTIERIAKTSTAGLVDTYTIFMSDGTTSFFSITNGADGDVSEATLNRELAKKAPVITETVSSTAIATFADGADDMPIQSLVAEFEPIQDLSNGDPSPTNICPITGHTEVTVTRTGKNLLDLSSLTPKKRENGITFTVNGDYSVTANGTASSQCQIHWRIPQATAQTYGGYTYSVCDSLPSGVDAFLELAGSPYTNYGTNGSTVNASIANTMADVNLIIRISSGTTLTNYTFYPMLRLSTEADSTYEAYNGTSVTVSLGDTYYGGTLDVATGVLTVTHLSNTIDPNLISSATDIGSNVRLGIYTNGFSDYPSTGANALAISNILPRVAKNYSADVTGFYFYDKNSVYIKLPESALDSADLTGVQTFLTNNPMVIVYPLETPQTYQLTAQEIDTLYGTTNTVWADTGNVTVTYPADTKMYIDNAIAALA